MAFNFPDPAEQQEVTNPITGSTYQWKNPPGKWVIVAKENAIVDIIYEGPNSPDPVGDYKLWYSTETLELYFYYTDANGNSAWVPTATPITMLEDLEADVSLALTKAGVAEAGVNANLRTIGLLDAALNEVENSLGNVTFQEVLDNGNVATKGFVLTDAENDAILVSPEQGRIMAGGIGETVPKYELRHVTDDGFLDTSIVALELDEDGKRFDIECEERVDNIHFRFGNSDKLIINKKGDAVFTGKVQVEPGTKGNEVATFGQIATLQEEFEQLKPSLEFGKWEYSSENYAQTGKYVLIEEFLDEDAQEQQCLIAYNECQKNAPNEAELGKCNRAYSECKDAIDGSSWVTTNAWEKIETIGFSKTAIDGTDHTFDSVTVGTLLDIFNDNDDGFMLARITEVVPGDNGTGFKIALIQSKGNANGPATVKFFAASDDDVELTNYVRKTGDTMTGDLLFEADAYETIGQTYPKIRFKAPDSTGENITDIKLWLDGSTYMRMNHSFRVDGSFKAAGVISAGQNLQYQGETRLGMSSSGGYLGKGTGTTKRALEFNSEGDITRFKVDHGAVMPTTPSPFMWYWEKKPGSEIANPKHFWWEGGKFLYLSSTLANGMILSKPDNLPSGANRFLSYSNQHLARHLKLWKQSSGGSWELMAWAVPYKYRFNYGGWVQIEYLYREGKLPDITNSLWAISCPDLL